MIQPIIFSDLDGTLLDYSTYSFEKALPALELLQQKNIPLIICSSKTRKEIEYYRKQMNNDHPFISENGGGIFIPKDYFNFDFQPPDVEIENEDDYYIVRLGVKYADLRNAFEEVRREGFRIKGFGDMTIREISEITDLSIPEAEKAKERDFDEPFVFEGNEREMQNLLNAIKAKGLNFTMGRFFHLLGNTDKGRAVSILISLYKQKFSDIVTVAVGDSPNDIPMLEKADYPVIVQKTDGSYDQTTQIPVLIKAEGIGPEGWNKAILSFLSASRPSEQ